MRTECARSYSGNNSSLTPTQPPDILSSAAVTEPPAGSGVVFGSAVEKAQKSKIKKVRRSKKVGYASAAPAPAPAPTTIPGPIMTPNPPSPPASPKSSPTLSAR